MIDIILEIISGILRFAMEKIEDIEYKRFIKELNKHAKTSQYKV